MALVEALGDLTFVTAFVVRLGLVYTAFRLAQALASVIDIHIPFVGNPFHGVAVAFRNAIVDGLEADVKATERQIAAGLSALIDSLGIGLGLVALLYLGVHKALTYLWSHALSPFVHGIVNVVRSVANEALAKAESAISTAWDNLTKAETYAAGRATQALNAARSYTDSRVASAASSLRSEFGADVQALRTAESAAIDHALQIAQDAKTTAAQAVTTAETAAAQAERQAVSTAEAAASAALATVKSIAITAEHDLQTIEGQYGALGAAGLIAAIPALATLVQAIAVDTGLENAECRSKVKGICATPSSSWDSLLGGALAIGFALSLRQLVTGANDLAGPLVDVIKQAG